MIEENTLLVIASIVDVINSPVHELHDNKYCHLKLRTAWYDSLSIFQKICCLMLRKLLLVNGQSA